MNEITGTLTIFIICLIAATVTLSVILYRLKKWATGEYGYLWERIHRLESEISRLSEDVFSLKENLPASRTEDYKDKSVFTVRPIRKTKRRSVAKTGEGDGQ